MGAPLLAHMQDNMCVLYTAWSAGQLQAVVLVHMPQLLLCLLIPIIISVPKYRITNIAHHALAWIPLSYLGSMSSSYILAKGNL